MSLDRLGLDASWAVDAARRSQCRIPSSAGPAAGSRDGRAVQPWAFPSTNESTNEPTNEPTSFRQPLDPTRGGWSPCLGGTGGWRSTEARCCRACTRGTGSSFGGVPALVLETRVSPPPDRRTAIVKRAVDGPDGWGAAGRQSRASDDSRLFGRLTLE